MKKKREIYIDKISYVLLKLARESEVKVKQQFFSSALTYTNEFKQFIF